MFESTGKILPGKTYANVVCAGLNQVKLYHNSAHVISEITESMEWKFCMIHLYRCAHLKASCLWDELRSKLPNWTEYIQSIRRIRQRKDRIVRFNIRLTPVKSGMWDLVHILRRQIISKCGYWASHPLWTAKSRPSTGIAKPSVGKGVNLLTWNTNGTKDKLSEIQLHLSDIRPDVIGIQETCRAVGAWPIRLHGYQTVETPKVIGKPGARGLLLAATRGIQLTPLGQESNYWITCKLYGGELKGELTVCTFYMPHKGSGIRKATLRSFAEHLNQLCQQKLCVVTFGDFNDNVKGLEKWLQRNVPLFSRVSVRGKPETFHRKGRRETAIDHFFVNEEMRGRALPARVLRDTVACSDHWPVGCKILGMINESNVKVPDRLKIVAARAKEARVLIAHHTLWSDLPNDVDADLDSAVDAFNATCIKVAQDTKCSINVTAKKRGVAKKFLQRTTVNSVRKLVKIKIAANKKLRDGNVSEAEKATLEKNIKGAEKTSRYLMRKDRMTAWSNNVRKACSTVEGMNAREHWSWVKNVMGGGRGSSFNSCIPVRCSISGELLTDSERISKSWEAHYRNLASDTSGVSKDASAWEEKLHVLGPDREAVLNLNRDMSWGEVCEIMAEMAAGKAPGEDAIVLEFLRAVVDKKLKYENVYPEEPSSSMGKRFFEILQCVWQTEKLPNAWKIGTVVSIPKKGDLTDKDNYRGITLMAVALKVMCTLISKRCSMGLENASFFDKTQAGFRVNEEAVGQAVALAEIQQRKLNGNEEAYFAFIDMRKAFDMVPHAAMLGKCRKAGIDGKVLNLITEIYNNSSFKVRSGNDLSDEIKLERGVRQGCPMSSVLFDIFINDLLNGTEGLGITVSGLDQSISGLLFADDLVLMADNADNLQSLLDHVSTWALKWGMEFGHNKCKVYGVGSECQEHAKQSKWILSDKEIDVCDHYIYLGLKFTYNLDIAEMVEARRNLAAKAAYSARPFFESKGVPVNVKVMVLKSTIIPILLYGAELWGLNGHLTRKCETLVHTVLRWSVGCTSQSHAISTRALMEEFNILSMNAQASERRTRAISKYPLLRTWISDLIANPMRHKKWSWVTGNKRWHVRYGPKVEEVKNVQFEHSLSSPDFIRLRDLKMDTPKRWARATALHVDEKARVIHKRKCLRFGLYRKHFSGCYERGFRNWQRLGVMLPSSCSDYSNLLKARCGGFITPVSLVEMRQLPENYKSECPLCHNQQRPDLCHLIVDCPYFKHEREGSGVADIISQVSNDMREDKKPSLSSRKNENLLASLLGGKSFMNKIQLDTWFPSGLCDRLFKRRRMFTSSSLVNDPNDPEHVERTLNFDTDVHSIMGEEDDTSYLKSVSEVDKAILAVALSCGATKIAKFLSSINRQVASCISKLPDLAVR